MAKWDSKKLQFTPEDLTIKVVFNGLCILLWDAFHLERLYQFHSLRDYDNLNIVVAFTVTIHLLNIGFVVATYYQEESVQATNAMLVYLLRVNSKSRRQVRYFFLRFF